MNSSRAFTLIEILTVVVIILILISIMVPNYYNAVLRAKITKSQAEIKTLANAIEMFRLDTNFLPVDGADGFTDWGTERIQDDFNGVGLSDHDKGRSMTEVFAPLTSPTAYLSQIPVDPLHSKRYTVIYKDSWLGEYYQTTEYYYECNDPETGEEGKQRAINFKYHPPLKRGDYFLRGWGPASFYAYGDFEGEVGLTAWDTPYNNSNGLRSAGEIAYHSGGGFIKVKYISEEKPETPVP